MKTKILSSSNTFCAVALAALSLVTAAGSHLQADTGVAVDYRLHRVRVVHGCRHPAAYYEQKAVQYLINHLSFARDINSDSDTSDGYYCLVSCSTRLGGYRWGVYFANGPTPAAAEAAARNLAIGRGGAIPSTIRVKARWHDDCRLRAGAADQEFDVID